MFCVLLSQCCCAALAGTVPQEGTHRHTGADAKEGRGPRAAQSGVAQRPLPPTAGARTVRWTPEHGAAAPEPPVASAGPRPRGGQRGDAGVAVGGQPSAPCPGATARRGGLAPAGCSRQAWKRTRRGGRTARHRGLAREATSPHSPSRWRQ